MTALNLITYSDTDTVVDVPAPLAIGTNPLHMQVRAVASDPTVWLEASSANGLLSVFPGTTGTPVAATSISNASPAVVTLANSFVANALVMFSTTGILPAPLQPNTVYYVSGSGLTAGGFEVSLTPGGIPINTNTAGSGTHSVSLVQPETIQLTLPNSKLLNLPPGVYVHSCVMSSNAATLRTEIWRGTLTHNVGPTQWTAGTP
jgi:hypothetical protein